MNRYLLSSLLPLLLVSCALCGVVSAKNIDLFEKINTQAQNPERNSQTSYDVAELASPSMAGDDDILLGHALAKITGTDKYFVLTKSFETATSWPTGADDKSNWKAQVTTGDNIKEIIAFGTVKKETNFYTLYAHRKSASGNTQPWDFKLATGAITGSSGSKEIKWTEKTVTDTKVTDKDTLKEVTPKDGTAFLVEKKPVYVLTGKKDSGNKRVFVVARMDGADADGDWTFIIKEGDDNCDAAFFSLGGKIYMAPKGETCANKALKVLDESGKKWDAATGDVADSLKTLEGKIDFVLPVKIKGKDVLLITEKKKNTGTPANSDYSLYVAREKNVKELPQSIVTNVEKASDASLFYVKEQLFFLSKRDAKVDLERLEDVPGKINNVLTVWDTPVPPPAQPPSHEDPKQNITGDEDNTTGKGGRGNNSSAVERVNMGIVLLCALFGMLAPLAL